MSATITLPAWEHTHRRVTVAEWLDTTRRESIVAALLADPPHPGMKARNPVTVAVAYDTPAGGVASRDATLTEHLDLTAAAGVVVTVTWTRPPLP